MTDFAQQFLNHLAGNPVPVSQATAILPEKANILIFAEQLKTGLFDIEYRKKNGDITEMTITLDPRLANYDPEKLKETNDGLSDRGQLTVWSKDRDGWRHLVYKNILSCVPAKKAPTPHAWPFPARNGVVTGNISPATLVMPEPKGTTVDITLTQDQRELFTFWLTNTVSRALERGAKGSAILSFTANGNKLTITEKNSGLTIGL